jgi:hypothetical protein
MCYTSNTSINAFVLNTISCFLLFNFSKSLSPTYQTDLKIISVSLLYTGLMQLYDYIFWNNPPPSSTNYNTTKLAMLTNNFNPVIIALIIIYFKNSINNTSKSITILYFIIILFYSIYSFNKIKYTYKQPISKDSLYWEWNHLKNYQIMYILYLVTVIYLLYKNINKPLSYILIFMIVFSYVFSYFKHTIEESTGRFWCYYASFIPLFILFYAKFVLQ